MPSSTNTVSAELLEDSFKIWQVRVVSVSARTLTEIWFNNNLNEKQKKLKDMIHKGIVKCGKNHLVKSIIAKIITTKLFKVHKKLGPEINKSKCL